MADEFIGIRLEGLAGTQAALTQLYPKAAGEGVMEANRYLLEELKTYPPYAYVSWDDVGGFRSERQRRYVMARIAEGSIKPGSPNRTQRLAQGWHTVGAQDKNQLIANDVDYAPYEYEQGQQARMHELQGWEVIPAFLAHHMTELVWRFEQGVRKAISEIMSHVAP